MDHKSFLIQLQSRLGKDKGEIDSYMSAFLQIPHMAHLPLPLYVRYGTQWQYKDSGYSSPKRNWNE